MNLSSSAEDRQLAGMLRHLLKLMYGRGTTIVSQNDDASWSTLFTFADVVKRLATLETSPADSAVDPAGEQVTSGPRVQESSSLSAERQLSQLREGLHALIAEWKIAPITFSSCTKAYADGFEASRQVCAAELTDRLAALLAASEGTK